MYRFNYLMNCVRPTLLFAILLICASFSFSQTETVSAPVPTPQQAESPAVTIQSNGDNTSSSPALAKDQSVGSIARDPSAPAYVSKEAPARIPRFEAAPVIDGKLDDAAWRGSAV